MLCAARERCERLWGEQTIAATEKRATSIVAALKGGCQV